jgi:hypothetical protein
MPSGEHRPAIIVRVDGSVVGLQVFADGDRDDRDLANGTLWVWAGFEELGLVAGTWHWPEREDEKPAAQSITGAGGIDAREEVTPLAARDLVGT